MYNRPLNAGHYGRIKYKEILNIMEYTRLLVLQCGFGLLITCSILSTFFSLFLFVFLSLFLYCFQHTFDLEKKCERLSMHSYVHVFLCACVVEVV